MRGLWRSAALAATMVLMVLAAIWGFALFRDGAILGGVLVFLLGAMVWYLGRRLFTRLLELP